VPRPNIFRASFEYEDDAPDGYRAGEAPVGKQAGGQDLTVRLYELPGGQSLCPYHYEYEEEWLLVLEGAVTLRTPDGEEQLETGDVVCFPVGPDGAHKVMNGGSENARVLMFSSSREPAVAVYPDSDKIGVWPGNPDDKVMVRRADGRVSYWDGEA
jgi:uncharacterized cupin superfamily protein